MSHTITTANVGQNPITFETGKIAKLADGAVVVTSGETIVLVSAVSATTVKEGQDFFPLTVDYKEKAAAVGKFPGGYFKREGRPSEKEILTARMTDRPLRPLFPKNYFYDTQIISILLSADGEIDPDILSINGASAALCVSDIPFEKPIAAVRVGRINGQFVVNPTHAQREESDLDLVYVGDGEQVIMIEGAANELPEEDFKKALDFAREQTRPLIAAQNELIAKAGKPKREFTLLNVDEAMLEIAYQVAGDRIEAALYTPSKVARGKAVGALREEVSAKILEKFPAASKFEISQAFDYLQKKAFRVSILDKQKRCDGRGLAELRQLSSETSVLPRAHGSALFARGETQAMALATLGTTDEAQMIDGYGGGETTKSFLLHYNFPPFSVGETGRFGGQNRREIGHGALAERSIFPVIPSQKDFPYALRVTSEVMESNGSTSMASVCAGVLADIIGSEDHFGDMDFKLCGTEQGVTGFQLDLKLKGISHELMAAAIDDARKNRGLILSHMTQTLPAPRGEMSKYAPRIETVVIPKDKIGLIIGPGGKTIKGIVAETGAEINVEEEGAHGLVHIYSNNAESLQRAKEIVQGMTKEIAIDEMYEGTVVSIKDFGAFVEVMPGKDGLVHISELADTRVNKVEDVVKVGDRIWVKCIGVDDKGKVKLSRRAAMKDRDIIASGGTVAPTPDVKVNVGETYEGTVVSLKDFGAFVEILPGKDGLVHISELADVRVNRVEDVVRVGDVISVKCIGIDDKGKVKLSRKAAMKERDKAASDGAASEGAA